MFKRLAVLALATLSVPAMAINLQNYRFTDSYRYSVLDDSLSEKFNGKFVFTGSLAYMHSPVSITNKSYSSVRDLELKKSNFLTLGFSYYLNPSVSIGIDALAVQNKGDDDSATYLGDTVLKSRINLFKNDGWSFSVNPQVFLPTGQSDSFAAVKKVAASLSAVAEKHLTQRWHLLGSIGYFTGKANHFDVIDYTDLILAQVGVSYDINEAWNANIETYRNFITESDMNQDEGSYFLTFKNKSTNYLSTYFGAGVAGFDHIDRDNYTVFAGVKLYETDKPAPVAQAPAPSPKPAPKPIKITTREDEKQLGALKKVVHVFFSNNSAEISSLEAKKVENILQQYKDNESIKHIVIEGYASKTGTTEHNQVLSQDRGEKVKQYLIKRGVPNEKLSIQAYGDASLTQYKEEAQNRRVEFRIYE